MVFAGLYLGRWVGLTGGMVMSLLKALGVGKGIEMGASGS